MSLLLLGPTDDYLRKVLAVTPAVVLLSEPERLTPWQRSAPCPVHLGNFAQLPELLLQATAIAAATPVRAVLSYTELGVVPAAIIGQMLGVPAPLLEPSVVTRNKLLTRQALLDNDLTRVRFLPLDTAQEGALLHNRWAERQVVKPEDGTGSRDVHVLAPGESVTLHPARRYIIESWLDGKEFSCETFSVKGCHHLLAITEKWLGGDNGLVETGHLIAPGAFDLIPEHWAYLQRCLDAIGLVDGPAHLEFKRDGDSIDIIECHNRPGGDRIWQLVELATGFDMVSAHARLLLDEPVVVEPARRDCAAIKFFEYAPGTVQSVRLPASLPTHVHWFELNLKPDDRIKPLADSFQRHGSLIASAPDTQQLHERLRQVIDHIEVIVV